MWWLARALLHCGCQLTTNTYAIQAVRGGEQESVCTTKLAGCLPNREYHCSPIQVIHLCCLAGGQPGVEDETEAAGSSPFAPYSLFVQKEMGTINNMMKVSAAEWVVERGWARFAVVCCT